MPDTPDARAAQALELSYALDIPGMPFQRSAAADLLRALAADVTQLSCDVVELKGRWEMAVAKRDALITAICGHPDHPEMVISTDDALRAAEQWRSDHNADIDRASRLEDRLSSTINEIDSRIAHHLEGALCNGQMAPDLFVTENRAVLRKIIAGAFAANRPEIPDSPDIDWQPIAGAPKDGTLFLSPQGPTFRQLQPCDADGNCADGGGWVVVLGCPEDGGNGVAHLYVPDGYLTRWAPMPSNDHSPDAEEIARNANCPGDPVPCLACKGTGTVPRGPRLCTTCDHGTTGTCAKNHGPATAHKGCSDWAASTGEAVTHG